MIKNIFIPEHVGNYYIFPQRIVGLDITKTDIFACQLYVHGKKITLEKFITQPLELAGTYQERVIDGLKKIMTHVDAYDAVHITLPSSLAIFKTLKLPFTSYEKIKMVIAYEIEPLLPFSISQASIDFIITKTDLQEKSAEVFVTAVQNQHVMEQISLCEQAGIKAELITIDMIALYTIYQQFPDFIQTTANKSIVLLDFGPYETRLAYLFDGQLKLIRTLPKGFLDQAKAVGKMLTIPTGQALEHLMRFGLEKNHDQVIEDSIKKSMSSFLHELSFTLNSFTQQTTSPAAHAISKIMLVGEGASIKGLSSYITTIIGINCEQIKTNELLRNPSIDMKQKNGGIPSENLVSLGAAFASLQTPTFNLLPKGLDTQDSSLFTKQLISAFILSMLLLIALIISSYLQLRSFHNETYESAQEVIEALSTIDIKPSPEEEGDSPETLLEELVKRAQEKVTKDERVVSEFSIANRASFLSYLYELSKLNTGKQGDLGLKLTHLTITPDKIVMSGEVSPGKQAGFRMGLKSIPFFGSPSPSEELDKTIFTNVQMPIIRTGRKARE